jgi:hypothetical protein
MTRTGRRILWALVGALLLLMLLGPAAVTRVAVARLNPTLEAVEAAPSARAVRLHATLAVADLHADALLWDRNLLRRGSVGHVDVPRLIDGRVALQAFTTVTKTPAGLNIEANSGDSDRITLLAVAQAWPPRTWGSLVERALHQADKLGRMAAASEGRLTIIRDRVELMEHLRRRDLDPERTAAFWAWRARTRSRARWPTSTGSSWRASAWSASRTSSTTRSGAPPTASDAAA